MSHIAITVSSPCAAKGRLYLSGVAAISDSPDGQIIGWGTDVAWDALPVDINKAILNAATAAALAAGYAIGAPDSKLLFTSAGAVSL